MTTKEEIMKLAEECGFVGIGKFMGFDSKPFEAFYHAARKPLEFERDVQKADIAFLNKQLAEKDAEIVRLKYAAENPNFNGRLDTWQAVAGKYRHEASDLAKQLAAANADRDAIAEQLGHSEIGKRRVSEELEEANAEILCLKRDVQKLQKLKEEYGPAMMEVHKRQWLETDRGSKLAAAQLQIQQYREALEFYVPMIREGDSPAEQALAIPTDTSALEAMIQKAGEVMREQCAESMTSHYLNQYSVVGAGHNFAKTIRALHSVTIGDLQG